jgi:Adenylate cyclase, family 3 (some proteins contain HAMP domain)
VPLFMDRHDVPGVKAEDVARAHVSDVAAEARHGVKFLAYWFDPDQGEAFCLAQAPSGESLTAVHRETHGLIPNEIISVSEDNILRFLGNMNDPVDHTLGANPFRAILFTDLEGSTSLLDSVGETLYMLLLTEHDLIIRRALVATRGREVKHTGDGIMASFDSVSNALDCSLAIQDGFAARLAAGQEHVLRVRIGIAAGEPVDHNDDLFGATVTLASRICAAADAGHILTSDVVHELGRTKSFSFGPGEDRTLKGFSTPTRVFELLGRDR